MNDQDTQQNFLNDQNTQKKKNANMNKIFQQPPKLLKFHKNYQNNKKHKTSK